MASPDAVSRIRDWKDLLLIISVVYFYGMGTALLFHLPTLGLASPPVFLCMGFIFLVAFMLELLLSWWNRRRSLMGSFLGALAYGVLAIYVAPLLYGRWILTYTLLEPVIVIFIGGLAFIYGKLFADMMYVAKPLTVEEAKEATRNLPGWKFTNDSLQKTFVFSDNERAVDFSLLVKRLGKQRRHDPAVSLKGTNVEVVLRTTHPASVTRLDLKLAEEIDGI